jgi:hypothetical protein
MVCCCGSDSSLVRSLESRQEPGHPLLVPLEPDARHVRNLESPIDDLVSLSTTARAATFDTVSRSTVALLQDGD